METTRVINHEMRGGKGDVIIDQILQPEQMFGKARVFGHFTIKPGCSIGYHTHENEMEAYYFLTGEGTYDDNGDVRTVKAGEVTWTGNGNGHSIENTGTEDLTFIALIVME